MEIYVKIRMKQERELPWDTVDWDLLRSVTEVNSSGLWPVLMVKRLRIILDWVPTLINMDKRGYTNVPTFDDGLGNTTSRLCTNEVP